METVEITVTLSSLRTLAARVEAARQTLARACATAAEAFRDVAPDAAAETERLRGEWQTLEPAFAPQQLHKRTRRLVVAERELREALVAARGVHAEGEAALAAARANVQQSRASAITPRDLAEAAELERLARELAIALAAAEDGTLAPAARLAALVAQALPRAVGGALRVLAEQRTARASTQLAEVRTRLDALRQPWPGEAELVALAAEVEASTGEPLRAPTLRWPIDPLEPPTLVEGAARVRDREKT